MKKFISLLLCLAVICPAAFSAGCSRSLPTSGGEPPAPASSAPESAPEPDEPGPPAPSESESEPEPPAETTPEPPAERDWRLMLVNPDNLLPEGWRPELAMTKYGYEVDSRIVGDVSALIEGAVADGVPLMICSAYRTPERSRQLFEEQVRQQLSYGLSEQEALAEAKKWVAPPGTSDHHTGLALDVVTPEYQVMDHGFFDTPAGRWMDEHCWDYGFVIRFPADKQDITGITYEPWHLRFVGKEHAAAMREANECLEEYVARLYGG